ncbi:hypothetical protein [Paenibacillus mellifer]|uniref:hypothetical protein n=1 Tax=Paenibacillus mellifer TaxID=2937794 RepID=UPI0027DF2581|nr:hypothetical protein [Paenibacillus mellifer]
MVLIFLPMELFLLRFRLSGSQILKRERAAAEFRAAFSFTNELLPQLLGLRLRHL